MPQMKPLLWLHTLMIMVTLTLIVIMKLYFLMINFKFISMKSFKKPKNNITIQWKW